MKQSHRASRVPAVLAGSALIAALIATTATADVTIEQKTVTTGAMGFGNGTSTSTLVVAGDRIRDDHEFTYTGRFKTFAGGGKPTRNIIITRLDRELIWTIDPQKQQYTELSFALMKAQMEAGMARAQADMKKSSASAKKPDVGMEYKVDVQRTGKKETVNGWAAEQVIVTVTGVPRDAKTGEAAGAFHMKMDEWLAASVPGQAEVAAYYRHMAEKVGLDLQAQRMGSAFMAQYGDAMREAAAKLKDLKGYAVRTTVTVSAGPSLTAEQKAEPPKERAAAQQERAEKSSKKESAENAEEGASAASEAKSGHVGGALSGFLARRAAKSMDKKAEKKSEEMAKDSEGADDEGVTFSAVTDVLKISTSKAATSFDPPAGYKLVEGKEK